MNTTNYFESLKFDRYRVVKKNINRVNNLKIIKVDGTYKKKKKYNYLLLNKEIKLDKDTIIVIDNNDLRIDNLIKGLDDKLNNYEKNINFFKKNKYKKNYTDIKNKLLLNIYEKIIKIYRKAKKNNISIKDIYLINYDKSLNNNFMIEELDNLLYVYLMPQEERINYIYDYMCDYLDLEFNHFNLCDFIDNKCVSRRDLECKGCKNPLTYGCCYTKGRVCPNLINNRCTIKSISCKLFTCRYLEKKGIKYRSWDYLIFRLFFSYRQLFIINDSIYTPKDIMMEKLLKKKKTDYIFNGIKKIAYSLNMFF